MTCPNELTLALYADGEYPGGESTGGEPQALETHLAGCARCRARLQALRDEVGLLAAALTREPALPRAQELPPFRRPLSPAGVAGAVTLLGLAAVLVSAAPGLIGLSVPAPLSWFDPFDGWGLAELIAGAALFLAERGGAIVTTLSELVAGAVVVALLVWIVSALRRVRGGPLALVSLAGALALLPLPAEALEIRRDEDGSVLIGADETIADSLIVVGETIEVAGNVEGDLIAFARRVVVRGTVAGVLVTGAETVTIEGEVGGSVLGFAETLNLSSARLGRNLFGFAQTIDADKAMSVAQNAVVFAERASLAGPVRKDVLGFAEQIELANEVGGSVRAFAGRVTLLAPARIGGDVRVHVPAEERLTVSPGAVVGGEIETSIREEDEDDSDYADGGFYLGQLLRFAAAFVTGLVLLALVPALRRVSLHDLGNTLTAGGVGVVALVATPIIALLVAVTIIGIPLALLGLLLWGAGLYLAKIVLAHVIGARLLASGSGTRHFAVALALGLLVVLVVVNVPFIGGLLNFLLTICGFGLLVLFLWRGYRDTRGQPAP